MTTQDHGQVRRTDPLTSHTAAHLVRPRSARARLLQAHLECREDGLTDEEAATRAGLSLASEYATRCSELMRAGLLNDTIRVRTGAAGMARLVRQITPLGIAVMLGEPVPPAVPACPKCGQVLNGLRPTLSPSVVSGKCRVHGWQSVKTPGPR